VRCEAAAGSVIVHTVTRVKVVTRTLKVSVVRTVAP
jgi:hypothetical protein